MKNASPTILGPGPHADKTGAVASRLMRDYSVPDRLLDKSASDVFEKPAMRIAYADPGRQYPVHTPAAAWVSAAAYHDSRSEDPGVGVKIKEACDWFGLSSEWERLKEARPAEPDTSPVKWAIPSKKMYPIDTAEQVKMAIEYFEQFSLRLNDEDRRTYAEELVKAAGEMPLLFSPDTLWRLEAEAGLGLPADNWESEFRVRAKMARESGMPELAEMIEKSANAVNYGSGAFKSEGTVSGGQTFRNAGELAALWKQLDQKMGWDFGDPMSGLVGETPSTAKSKLASMTRSGTGHWYKNEDLDLVPDRSCTELCGFGPVVCREAKMAALADPASAFEKLALSQGVEPIEAPKRARIDWKAEAAGVDNKEAAEKTETQSFFESAR